MPAPTFTPSAPTNSVAARRLLSRPLMYIMPPIAGVVSWITLGETFTWLKISGALVTMTGVAWAQFGGGSHPTVSQADSG